MSQQIGKPKTYFQKLMERGGWRFLTNLGVSETEYNAFKRSWDASKRDARVALRERVEQTSASSHREHKVLLFAFDRSGKYLENTVAIYVKD